LTLAVRLWTFAGTDDYVGYTPPEKPVAFGERNQVEELFHLNDLRDRVGLTSNYLLLLLSVLAAIAGMVIYFQRPGEREYLWFGLFLLFEGLGNLAGLLQAFYALPYIASGILDLSVALLDIQMQLLMFWQLLHGRRNWAFWCASSCVAAGCLVGVLDLSGAFGGFNLANALEFPIWGFYNLYILVLAVRGVRRGLPDARFLLFPVCLFELTWFAMDYVAFGSVAGLDTSTVNTLLNQTFQSPFPFNLNDISSVLFLAAMLGIMIRRFTRTAQREEQQTRELEAARAVQQVLIPQSLPEVAGYRVESVYRPFGEVGGDFFQILPMNQGGMLAVIGDVSGKGVPAAMMVSLLVGAFHTLAETTASPAAILDGLNRRALGRSRGGFTTCLVIRADADGRCTVANAGHLSPYRKGEEVSVEAGLPLGLSAEAEYGESLVDLAAGEQLTLLSDGVLEARSAAGELYGFDRTRLLSQEDAERIADAAQVFGQEDDITVLTMTYAAGAA
jgi:hypothetical protein